MKFSIIPLKYALIASLVYFVLFLVIYYAGENPMGLYSFFGIWIPVVAIFMGIKHYRDRELNGYISFIQGLGTGMFMAFALSLVFNLLCYGFGSIIGTDIIDRQMTETIKWLDDLQVQIDNQKKLVTTSPDEIKVLQDYYDQAAEQLEKHPENFTLGAFIWKDFQSKLYGGFFVSLIIALILKRKEPIFSNQQPQ